MRLFANVTGSVRFFGDVTSSAFGDVTTVAKEIFFGDVTANLLVTAATFQGEVGVVAAEIALV